MKLYVIVRNDLSQSQKSVQAGHAIAEFLLHRQTEWDNGTLVILGVDNKQELEKLTYKLNMKDKALVQWEKALELDPEQQKIREKINMLKEAHGEKEKTGYQAAQEKSN